MIQEAKHLKRLPNLLLLFSLIVIAGVAEAFGISVLVPVVSTMLDEEANILNLQAPFNFIPKFLSFLSLPPTFSFVLGTTFIIMVTSFVLIHLQERVSASTRYEFVRINRDKAVIGLLGTHWEYLSKVSTGELSNKLLIETDRAGESLMALLNMVSFFINLLLYAFLAFLLSWEMSLIASAIIVLTAFLSKWLLKAVSVLGKKSVTANNKYNKFVIDVFRSSKLLKALGLEKHFYEKLSYANANTTELSKGILVNQSILKLQMSSLVSLALVAILYAAVVPLKIEFSVLAIFLFIVLRLTPKFFSFQGQMHSYMAHRASLAVLDEVLMEASNNQEKPQDSNTIKDALKGEIEFRDVSYKYPENEDHALKNINLLIEPGSFVGVVGRSGAGKSTFLDLVLGIISPVKGNISIDGNNLEHLEREQYRKQIGFVPQESLFFDGTIRENLCLNYDVNEEHITECLKIAQIYDFVNTLDDRLDTYIGEAGGRLSGGQRQRLSIARALIRKPKILIFDEATSSLDSQSERLFQNALQKIAERYTLVVVAHRISTIEHASNIFVLADGRLVESGNYKELVNQGGTFLKLSSQQDSSKSMETPAYDYQTR